MTPFDHASVAKTWFLLGACLVTVACTATSVGTAQGNPPDIPATLPAESLAPTALVAVSASDPGPDAAAAMEKCHIGDQIPLDKVAAMAEIPIARDLVHYIPLTGREPRSAEAGPAWVIQIRGDVQERGDEIWSDPTCVVTTNDAGYYATGPVKNTVTGDVLRPETPTVVPDRPLPSLAP